VKASGFGGEDIVRDYIAKYSNWGRWGEDDELGALNYVGPEQRCPMTCSGRRSAPSGPTRST
jgi:hypothetical protein